MKCVSGQRNVGAPWVTGQTVTVAIHDVATATSTASGRQLRNTMPNANSTPAAGTLYTAARPEPAAQPSRMRRCSGAIDP